MKPYLNLALLAVLACLVGNVTPSFAAERPNILFIMADDLGYGDLGCYGQQHIRTPNIDQLAAEGMRFTDAYAGSTVCAPSRSVLMTGQHTGHTTVRGNFGKGGVRGLGGGKGRVPLKEEDETVAEVLDAVGYVTGITGKWGLGEPSTSGTPNKKGFDEWFGYLNQRRAHTYYPDFLWLNEDKYPLPGNTDGKKEQYTHDLFTQFALKFIDTHAGGKRPFFLYVPYTVPHARYEIPSTEPYTDKEWKKDEKVHAAMITRMDQDVGRIMTLLKEKGVDENTLVFFCSDNGAAKRWEGRFDSSGALRGHKRDMYEGGIRTPMIVRWPGRVPVGKTSDTPWYFPDVLPTLADVADAPFSADVDGISILPTILGKDQPELSNRPMYWEFFERGFQQAARRGHWKAIRKKRGGPIELYDLSKDIGEQHDIASKNPDIVESFDRYFSEARTESESWPLQ